MKHLSPKTSLYSIAVLLFLVICQSELFAQTVYFQRQPPVGSGTVSSLPIAGPESALKDFITGVSQPTFGGIALVSNQGFFYSEVSSSQIILADKLGNVETVVLSTAGLNSPGALSYDSVNNFLYIADIGNERIVRVNLNNDLPADSVEEVINNISETTDFISDMHYNPADSRLYWINSLNGTLHRAAVNEASLPINPPEALITVNPISASRFDFDNETPQNIYITDDSVSFKGIYISPVPAIESSNLNETIVFDMGQLTGSFVRGIAVEKAGSSICYSFYNGSASSLRCGNRATTALASLPEVASSIFSANSAPYYLEIESGASIVRPDTKLPPALSTVNTGTPKPSVTLLLQEFAGAATKKLSQKALLTSLGIPLEAAQKAKIGFRYSVEIKRVANSAGTPFNKKKQELKKVLTKRNELTVKNLKNDSIYEVRYRVEITSKLPKQDLKVAKKTAFSPSSRFTIN